MLAYQTHSSACFITAMTSAAGSARIPYKHSTTTPRQGPRDATSSLSAPAVPDVKSGDQKSSSSVLAPHDTGAADTAAGKVDSKSISTASSVKNRAHSRLASFGRIRSRGSVQHHYQHQREAECVPDSPSDACSHKRSDTSTLSNSSTDTSLSDDPKADIKSPDERPPRRSFWLASSNIAGECAKENIEHHERLIKPRPRMMHQTSSKLLRMTEDERPFTRVRTQLTHIS